MLDNLLVWDQWLFELINVDGHTSWLDQLFPLWRDKRFWIPAYLLLAAWLIYRFRWKGFFLILGAILTIAISDPLSSEVVKKQVKRDRPCRSAALAGEVQVLIPCGGGYSFPSSHATNHFALAVFLYLTLGRLFRSRRWLLLLWAATVAYGQVYVGVHYPLDVLAGALLGSLVGGLIAYLYSRTHSIRIEACWSPEPGP